VQRPQTPAPAPGAPLLRGVCGKTPALGAGPGWRDVAAARARRPEPGGGGGYAVTICDSPLERGKMQQPEARVRARHCGRAATVAITTPPADADQPPRSTTQSPSPFQGNSS
jgi:hypothetical protein